VSHVLTDAKEGLIYADTTSPRKESKDKEKGFEIWQNIVVF